MAGNNLDSERKFRWGFKGKSALEVIQALGIPASALIMTLFLTWYDNHRESERLDLRLAIEIEQTKKEEKIASDIEQYKTLRNYFDSIGELMKNGLGVEKQMCDSIYRSCSNYQRLLIAEARSKVVLEQLVPENRALIINFLRGTKLVEHNSVFSMSGFNLTGVNLSRTDMEYTNLSGVNLSEANLIEADFLEASLSGANLSGADLRGSNLGQVSLSGANLTGANLSGVNLKGAKNLTCAQLIKAKNWEDAFSDIECSKG